MARLMLLLLLIAPLILTSNTESGQKVIQFKILRFHQDSFSLTLPKLNAMALIYGRIMGYRCLHFAHTEVTEVENLTGVV